jgi:hypothetical protein
MKHRIEWDPEDRRPFDAAVLEAEIGGIWPGIQARMTLVGGEWRVRALRPAAMCTRGSDFGGRDASAQVAQVLVDHGHAARPIGR